MNDEKEAYFIDCGGCDEGDHDETIGKLNRLIEDKDSLILALFNLRKETPKPGLYALGAHGCYGDPRNGIPSCGIELTLRRVDPPDDGSPTPGDFKSK